MVKKILIFLLALIIIQSCSAVQPSVNIPISEYGIEIAHPINDFLKQGETHYFHFHLFDINNSLPFLNSSTLKCTFHLYNSSGDNVLEVTYVSSDNIYDWEQIVDGHNFSRIGKYAYIFQCNNSNMGGFYSHDFEVTPSGTSPSVSQGMMYILFFIGAFAIFFLSLYYAVKIPWKHQRDDEGYIISVNDLRWVKVLCIGLCYILLMSITGLMKAVTSNFIPELGVDKMFEWIYWLMLSFLYPIIVCSLVFALIIFLTDKKIVKALERGIPTQ